MDVRRKSNLIAGRIIGDGSGVGIPDLIVAALDFDLDRLGRTGEPERDAQRQRAAREAGDRKGAAAMALEAMEAMPGVEAAHLQRLGSVLTGRDGSFQLPYDDDLFTDGGEGDAVADRRPDIILLVLAHDRPRDGAVGLKLSERILFQSQPIQFESGRIENFIVRLPEDQLAEHGIFVPREAPDVSTVDPASYEAFEVRQAQFRNDHATVAAGLIAKLELPRLQIEKKVFDQLMPGLVSSPLGPGASFAGLSPSKDIINTKIYEGFQGIGWLSLNPPVRSGRVYLTAKELERLGTSEAAVSATGGDNITFADLLALLGYSAGPYRNRDLLSQVKVRRALAALGDAAAPTPPSPQPPVPGGATVGSLRSSVLERLEEQVQGLAREPAFADPANDLSRIRQVVDQLEQTTGIANVAATHEMDVLQVAFEPVWTAAFDFRVVKKVKELYRQTAKEDGSLIFKNVFTPWDGITDIVQLKGLVGDLVSAVDGARTTAMAHVGKLAKELADELSRPYSFEYFAPGSINYGILQTYRQAWTPITYQVGRVVDSIPLTPSETQTTKLTVTVKRRRKTSSRELSSLKRTDESSIIGRTEIEAMEKAAMAMTSQTSAQAGFNIGIGSIGGTATFGLNQTRESQRVHKSFAEVSRKASQEVRRETEVQYEVEVSDETLSETTRTLRNANDEMTITYVLYELERRYLVASQLQSVQPVLMVALPVPAPNELNDAWLLQHASVIREVLLDDRLEEALDILEDSRSRDEVQISIFKENYDAAYAVRKKADDEFERLSQLARARREETIGISTREKVVAANEPGTGERIADAVLSGGLSELFGGDDNKDDILRAQREAVEKQLEYLEKEIAATAETRDKASAILNDATDKYNSALTSQAMADQKLFQLRLHVRGNLYYYLHEIWKRRDPDDLFFSLYDLEVPFLEPVNGTCSLRLPTADELDENVPGVVIGGQMYIVEIAPAYKVPTMAQLPKKRLVEIADLDRPLGFKGNYVIFPLRESSLLTDFMTVGFLDGYYGVRDPALNSSYSAPDLLEYARSVWTDPVSGLTAADRTKLAELVTKAGLRNPGFEAEVVLPTGKVWMEALKGGQALLEPFKLAHRALDVLKVEEEVRRERLENLRRAQRVGLEEPALDDPDVERMTVVKGMNPGIVVNPDP